MDISLCVSLRLLFPIMDCIYFDYGSNVLIPLFLSCSAAAIRPVGADIISRVRARWTAAFDYHNSSESQPSFSLPFVWQGMCLWCVSLDAVMSLVILEWKVRRVSCEFGLVFVTAGGPTDVLLICIKPNLHIK